MPAEGCTGIAAASPSRLGRPRVPFVVLVLLLALIPRTSFSQVPDTIPRDTVPQGVVLPVPIPPEQVGTDTVPHEVREAAASLAPIPAFPVFPTATLTGFDAARWEWQEAELRRLPGLTLLELFERVPGLVVIRGGNFGRPAGLTALGLGGARVRVFLDGYALDPHDAASYPVEAISLADLSRVVLERSLSEIRIWIHTFQQTDPEPQSYVEMGTGVLRTRLLRALFSRGFGDRSVATAAFDLTTTGGVGIREDYRHSNTAFRWNYLPSPRAGLQFELRRTAIDRGGSLLPQETSRNDVILRARAGLSEYLTFDALLGHSTTTEQEPSAEGPFPIRALQGAARLAVGTGRVFATVAGRGRLERTSPLSAPPWETEAELVIRPGSWFRLEGTAHLQMADGNTVSLGGASASLNPFPALTLFGSAQAGSRLLPFLRSSSSDDERTHEFSFLAVDASGFRAGGELVGALGAIGGAYFTSAATTTAPFGLFFDRDSPAHSAPSASGMEVYAQLHPIPRSRLLRVEGWHTLWLGTVERTYAPVDLSRAALTVHGSFLGDQFEPYARAEIAHRGGALLPRSVGEEVGSTLAPFQTINLHLGFRILDVRAFLYWENLLAARSGVPVTPAPAGSPLIVYGASWRFRN